MFRILLSILVMSIAIKSYTQNNYKAISRIGNDTVWYNFYKYDGQKYIDVSDLILIDNMRDLIGSNDFFKETTDIRQYLLSKGYAKLKDTSAASPTEIAAQNIAKKDGSGLWAIPSEEKKKDNDTTATTGTNETTANNSSFDFSPVYNVLILIGKILLALGLITPMFIFLYKRFYIERKLKLLILGEPSSGKTALFYNLIDPNISKTKILELSSSRSRPNCKSIKKSLEESLKSYLQLLMFPEPSMKL